LDDGTTIVNVLRNNETGNLIYNIIYYTLFQKKIETIQGNQTLTRGADVSGDVVGRQLQQVVRQVFRDFRHQVSEVLVVLNQVHLQRHRRHQQQRQSNDVSDLHGSAEVSKHLYISKYIDCAALLHGSSASCLPRKFQTSVDDFCFILKRFLIMQ